MGLSRYGAAIEKEGRREDKRGEEKTREKRRGEGRRRVLTFLLLASFAVSLLLSCGLLFISIKNTHVRLVTINID